MEIHLGLLPYPKENDTSEEVSLYYIEGEISKWTN
jgi:hypothetical protein